MAKEFSGPSTSSAGTEPSDSRSVAPLPWTTSSVPADLHGKVALITGVGRVGQIGHAVARGFGRAGAKLLLADVNAVGLADRVKEFAAEGIAARASAGDLTQPAAARAATAAAQSHFGGLDILVNVAGGFFSFGPFTEVKPEILDREIAVNFKTAFFMCQAAMPLLMSRGSGGGAIVNFASIAVVRSLMHMSAYSAAKSAVAGLTRELARLCLGCGLSRRGLLRCRRRHLLRRDLLPPRLDAVGDHACDQAARADRVVVAGDRIVRFVRVAVGIHERDDRHAEAARLAYRELLLAQVDDERSVRLPAQICDAAEVVLELLELGEHAEPLLRGQQLELPFLLLPAQVVQAVDAIGDRAPVRQQAAEPAMVHVRHSDALRLLFDCVLRLLLGADEEDRAVPFGEVAHERVRLLEQSQRLLKIDDVDAAAFGEDESLHLRVPAAGLVAEMDSGLQELAHGDDCHGIPSCG